MAVPKSAIGSRLDPITAIIERGRLAFFAEAIGETDPVYSDLSAARAAGHPDLPVPPTFLFGMLLESSDPFGWMTDLGIDLRFLLHGNESFVYHSVAHAGDTVILQPVITDVFDKRNGALEFMTRQTDVTTPTGDPIATLNETVVVRHPELEVAR